MRVAFAHPKELPAKNFISTAYDFEIPLHHKVFHAPYVLTLKIPVKQFVLNHVKCFNVEKVQKSIKTNATLEEKILSIFEHEEIISGEKKYIAQSKPYFFSKITKQVKAKKPISFTLLQFPFKIPNPLKTERVLPDLGEIVYLYQLHLIAQLIKSVYAKGAKFVILGESFAFRDIADISLGEAIAYRNTSRWWIKHLGFNEHIEIIELRDAEQQIPNFYASLEKKELALRREYQRKNKEVVEAVSAVLPTLFSSANVKNIALEHLMNVYNTRLKKNELNNQEREILEELNRNVMNIVFRYIAYHSTIKEERLREKLWPNNIGVSPIAKPHRFGVFPLNNRNKLYPIHGVPVYQNDAYVTVHYKVDVMRNDAIKYAYVLGNKFREEKQEKDPFFYSEVKILDTP